MSEIATHATTLLADILTWSVVAACLLAGRG